MPLGDFRQRSNRSDFGGKVINGGTSNRLGVREREAETRSAVFPRKDKILKDN